LNDEKVKLLFGSFMHDIGKIIYRANLPEYPRATHSVLGWEYLKKTRNFNDPVIRDNILYHHAKDLARSSVSDDSTVYITYMADNISSGIDRKYLTDLEGNEIEGNDSSQTQFCQIKTIILHI